MKTMQKLLFVSSLILTFNGGFAQAKEPWELNAAEARAALGPVNAELARAPDQVETLKTAGILLHQIARNDPKREEVELAERHLKRARELAPADQEIAAACRKADRNLNLAGLAVRPAV